MEKINIHLDFLKSALDKTEIDSALKWINDQNKAVEVSVKKVDFKKLDKWYFSKDHAKIAHETGKFFSIDGIRINTTWGNITEWDQPIINQPEIGFLGFIVKKINGVLHFLVQAKIEPGNVNYVQLSPTLQATRSNFQQAHQGRKPLYLEYFKNASKEEILIDQLQSEQGARFLKKRNRNIIIKIDGDIEMHENFIWLTLGQLKSLMQIDNIVNMDTRTVISGISFGNYNKDILAFSTILSKEESYQNMFLKSTLSMDESLHSFEDIISFMTELKSTNDLDIKKIPLKDIRNWEITENQIRHIEKKYFKVIGVEVEIGNREVVKWSQPMVEPAQDGLCAFVCKKINGILHFAVQAKLECGNHDIFEFAPTIQTLTGGYKNTPKNSLPFLDYVLSVDKKQKLFDTLQSEEGGRFYKEQNKNIIVIAGDEISEELPSNFIWMTLNQLNKFIQFNNHINIQARNLIASISFA